MFDKKQLLDPLILIHLYYFTEIFQDLDRLRIYWLYSLQWGKPPPQQKVGPVEYSNCTSAEG